MPCTPTSFWGTFVVLGFFSFALFALAFFTSGFIYWAENAFFGAVSAVGSTPLCGHALPQRLEFPGEHLRGREK